MIVPVGITSPLPYAVALLLVLAVCWRRLPRSARYAGVIVEVLLFASMTPLGAKALARMVESRLPPSQSCEAPEPTTVVVVSAGVDRPPRAADDYAALHGLSVRRLFAAVKLWRRIPDARLVISGGGYRRIPDAVLMANLAEQLGVPAQAIELEDRSRTTWQNAQFVAALSPPVPKRIWLVTTTLHLPRALGAFRAWGFEPCAWSSGSPDEGFRFGLDAFIPQGQSVETTKLALHELLGEAEYTWLEWRHARAAAAEARH